MLLQLEEQLAEPFWKLEGIVSLHNGSTSTMLSSTFTFTNGVRVTVQTPKAPVELELLAIVQPLKVAVVNVSCTCTKVSVTAVPVPSSMYVSMMGLLADTADCVLKLITMADGVTADDATF